MLGGVHTPRGCGRKAETRWVGLARKWGGRIQTPVPSHANRSNRLYGRDLGCTGGDTGGGYHVPHIILGVAIVHAGPPKAQGCQSLGLEDPGHQYPMQTPTDHHACTAPEHHACYRSSFHTFIFRLRSQYCFHSAWGASAAGAGEPVPSVRALPRTAKWL